MKKLIGMKNIIVLVTLLMYCICSYAQVTLIHQFAEYNIIGLDTYVDAGTPFESIYEPVDCYVFDTDEYGYYSMKIYNLNCQFVKNIDLPTEITRGHGGFSMKYMGRHLVNTDDKMEFFVRLAPRAGQNVQPHCYILNEDGFVIYDFGEGETQFSISSIHKVGNQLRAFFRTPSLGGQRLYALGGTYNPSTMVVSSQYGGFQNPYPNPSSNVITLPYTLHPGEITDLQIFNMSGQLVETFKIGSDFDKIQINISNYPKGIYTYTYKGVTKKFVVQ